MVMWLFERYGVAIGAARCGYLTVQVWLTERNIQIPLQFSMWTSHSGLKVREVNNNFPLQTLLNGSLLFSEKAYC